MSEKSKRTISFSDTPRIRSFSNCDPVHRDALLQQHIHVGLRDPRLQKLNNSSESAVHRRYSEISRPEASRLHVTPGSRDPPSPRPSWDTKHRKHSLNTQDASPAKKDLVTVDQYITTIVQMCSNEALASPLYPPPKGSEEYEQVLEELKEK